MKAARGPVVDAVLVVELLQDIVGRLDRIERRLAARSTDAGRVDEHLTALLTALVLVAGDAVFSSREVIQHGDADSAFRDLLVAADCLTPTAVGYLLRDREGSTVGDRRLVRVGRDNDGAIWQFVAR